MVEHLLNNKCTINEHGVLFIKRKSRNQEQLCRHSSDGILCGDYCPLFFEANILTTIATSNNKSMPVKKDIVLLGCSCGSQIAYEIESDERE